MSIVKSQTGPAKPETRQLVIEPEKRPPRHMQQYFRHSVDVKQLCQNSDFQSPDLSTKQTSTFEFPQFPNVFLPVELPYRSPESVEMDEIMAAMVLTSLFCSPVVQSPQQRGSLPSCSVGMESCGGELSDSGSSGYWSWEHGSVSPALSPSITETDSSMAQIVDEGLHVELEPKACDRRGTRSCKTWNRGAYRCLWPGCGKVLTSRVGMKHHIRLLHLSSCSEQSHKEEDFYYTEISSEEEESEPLSPSLSVTAGLWSTCSSTYRQPTSGEVLSPSSTLNQSAPSSVWQIHTEHLYQACAPIKITVPTDSMSSCDWTSSGLLLRPQITTSHSCSISVGEQWLQRNSIPTRSHSMSASPFRGHCSIRKGRGEAKKCRKVYGVDHRDQWCTACRWKKACQRFPD